MKKPAPNEVDAGFGAAEPGDYFAMTRTISRHLLE
jgi:hypothetical protein